MGTLVQEQGGVRVLKVDGELSGPHVREFRKRVEEQLCEDARDFVVDFAEATGVDSAGLEALTWLKRECDDRLGLVKLCSLCETLRKVLEITRLDKQLDQSSDLEDALASLA